MEAAWRDRQRNTRDKAPSPVLAGEVLRAILNDTRYPATLRNGVTLRIRAEREVTGVGRPYSRRII